MAQKMTVQALTEGAIMAGLTIILILIGNLPFIGAFALLFCSIPITIITVRQGKFAGGLTSVLAALLVGLLFGPLTAIAAGLQYILLGWVMGFMFHQRKSAIKTIHASVITAAFAAIALLFINLGLMGFSPETIAAYLESYQKEMLQMYETTGMTAMLAQQGMTQVQIDNMLVQVINLAIRIMPAMMVVSHGAMAIITYFITTSILKRLKIRIPRVHGFQNWILPGSFVWLLIAVWALWLAGDYINISWMNIVVLNLLLICAALLLLDGLALSMSLFKFKEMSMGMKVFAVFSVMFFFTGFIAAFILTGLADLLFDFRKLRVDNKKEQNKKEQNG